MLVILPWRCRSNLIFGLMVAERTSLLSVGLKWLVLEFTYLLLSLLLIARYGELQKSMVMLVWSVAVLSCQFLRVFADCRRTGLVI